MAENLLGQGKLEAHQHGRPDYGVEPDNFLPHNVDVGRPIFIIVIVFVVTIAQGGDIVGQGVHPDIYHVTGVKFHGHSPGKGGAGYAKVLKSGLYKIVNHLIDTGGRLQKAGSLQKGLNTVGIGGQPEEIGLLLRVVDLPAAIRAFPAYQLALRPKAFAGGAVKSLVGSFINVPLIVHLLENLLYCGDVVVVCRTDKPVVGDIHELPKSANTAWSFHNIVHKGLGIHTRGHGLLLNFLTVLIGACKEHDIITAHSPVPGNCIRCHGAVGMPDMKLVRWVVNRRCDIKCSFTHESFLLYFQAAPKYAETVRFAP